MINGKKVRRGKKTREGWREKGMKGGEEHKKGGKEKWKERWKTG